MNQVSPNSAIASSGNLAGEAPSAESAAPSAHGLLGAGAALADQALISGCGFLFSVLVCRRGGLDDFGSFGLAMSALVLATNVHAALFTNPLTVLLPEFSEQEAKPYLARLRRMQRWLPPLLLALSLPLAALPQFRIIAPVTALGAGLCMAAEYHRKLCYAHRDERRALIMDLAGYLPLLAAWFLPWIQNGSAHIEGMAIIAITSLMRWGTGALLTAERNDSMAAPAREVLRRHFEYGRWGVGQCLASWTASQLYLFIVAGVLSIEDSGAMNACLKIVGVANVLLWGLEAFLLPRLRRIFLSQSAQRFRRRVTIYGTLLFIAVCPLLIPCLIAPGPILRVVYGADAAERGAALLPIYAAMYLVLTLEIVFTLALSSMKRPQAGFVGYTICAVLTIVLGPFVVHRYGALGAAIALLANHLVRCMVMGWAFLRPLPKPEKIDG